MVRKKAKGDAGFSLLEALVALVVLAVSAKAILSATEAHTRNVLAVSDRQVALWVAENRLTELTIGTPGLPDTVSMAQADWLVRTTTRATDDPDLIRADISVSLTTAPDTALARLTGYLAVQKDAT